MKSLFIPYIPTLLATLAFTSSPIRAQVPTLEYIEDGSTLTVKLNGQIVEVDNAPDGSAWQTQYFPTQLFSTEPISIAFHEPGVPLSYNLVGGRGGSGFVGSDLSIDDLLHRPPGGTPSEGSPGFGDIALPGGKTLSNVTIIFTDLEDSVPENAPTILMLLLSLCVIMGSSKFRLMNIR
jgi:hypothetical protein